MLGVARVLGAPLGEILGLLHIPAEALEEWRLLCALSNEPRLAALAFLRTLAASSPRRS